MKLSYIDISYIILFMILTFGGIYIVIHRIEVLGWFVVKGEFPVYILIHLAMSSLLYMFWALGNLLEWVKDDNL